MENRKQIYILDRWYYIVRETDSKLVYASIPTDIGNGNTLELNKKTYEVKLLCFKNNKLIAKINTNTLKNDTINFHYKEKEPQLMTINDNIYVNLFMEAFINFNHSRLVDEGTVIIRKKKIMRKMCYWEPDFPIDEYVPIDSLEIKSDTLDYYKEVSEYLAIHKKLLIDYIEYKPKKTVKKVRQFKIVNKEIKKSSPIVDEDHPVVYNLDVADSIYYYDRIYKLSRQEIDRIHYSNEEDDVRELSIKIDPVYHNVTGIFIKYKDSKGKKNPKYLLTALPNNIQGITTTFQSCEKVLFTFKRSKKEKTDIYANDKTRFRGEIVFDKNGKINSFNLVILGPGKEYHLTADPIFTNTYHDNKGVVYHMLDSNFSTLLTTAKYSFNGFNTTKQKILTKN